MLLALSLNAGHDRAGTYSNVAAACALRGVDTEVADLMAQGASHQGTHPGMFRETQETLGRKVGRTTGPTRGDTAT